MKGLAYVGNFLSSGPNPGVCADLSDRLETSGWVVQRTSTERRRVLRLADMMRTIWTRRRLFDRAIVDVFSGPAFVWAEVVCFELRRLGKPYVLTLHGGNLPAFGKRWPGRVRKLLESAAAVTAPSNYLRTEMQSFRSDIILVPNAIDTNPYVYRERREPKPRLVWVRAMHEIYNPLLAVDVLERLLPRFPDASLTMLGPDKHDGTREAVMARAAARGLESRLHLVGPVPRSEIAQHLDAADIFLNTTNVDNTPISVLEAMASGLPIVSTDVGGIPFMIMNDREALLVPPNDASAMTAAVFRILEQEGVGAALSRAARATALHHDWSVIMDRWNTVLDRVPHA